jgi:hypothetical protein
MTTERIDEYLDDLDNIVSRISNDLAYIDNIGESLFPNPCCDEDEPDSGINAEQEERYYKLMDALVSLIRNEFEYRIPELNKKE